MTFGSDRMAIHELGADRMTVSPTVSVLNIGPLRLLQAVVAKLPTDRTYTADSGRWAEAVHELANKYSDDWPDLFSEFAFYMRPGARPYSPQVSEFLTSLALGKVVEVSNPGFTRLRILASPQKTLAEEYAKRLAPEGLNAVRYLAKAL